MMRVRRSPRPELDMTNGPMLPGVIRFSIPLILSGVLQLLYNAADIIVVGNYAGSHALAAVSSTGSLINLLVNIFFGMSVGASVITARAWGAGDRQQLQSAVHTAITLALIFGFVVGAIGVVLAHPMLELMQSPPEVIDLSTLYVQIFFMGMPFNMLYNFGAAIMRATGDTKRPLYYLAISGLVNVVLNLILVIVFKMSVAGVAIATITSQAISMLMVLNNLMHSQSAARLDWRKLRIDKAPLLEMLRIGLPAGFQASLFSISNVLIQSSVNSFGAIAVAGNGAASSIEGFVYTAMNAIHQADITFASQNWGAKKPDRVRRTLWVCLATVAVIGLVTGFTVWGFGAPLLGLYNNDPEVIRYGLARMSVILPTYFICGLMDVATGQMRGIGYSILPMIVSLTGACLLRIVWIATVFSMPEFHTLTVLYLSYPASWIVTFIAHMSCYFAVQGKIEARLKV